MAKLARVGADLVFTPARRRCTRPGSRRACTWASLAAPLCGRFRPGHFEGVATVVTKLFALAGPCVAVFGEKDYQQLAYCGGSRSTCSSPSRSWDTHCARDDGLAMSSRNAYLSSADRLRALSLSRGLDAAWRAFDAGERDAGVLRRAVRAEVERGADSIDYVDVTDADSLAPFPEGAKTADRALVAIACRLGATRLIDNVILGEDPSPVPR